ncbi:extracellular solute-binding protein [Paenibacillus sp. M1]|uniref:Extracellular solute-binding protein n=1 Tax=Paenibacillus haidiansis TaxID=1574488 RepID=A0ABU7VRU9_9BACL
MMLSLTLVAVLLLPGCSFSGLNGNGSGLAEGGTSRGEPNGEETVIHFMHLWPEGSANAQFTVVKNIIADYESLHPDVRIETEVLGNDQYKEKIKVLASSNELPDVGMTWSDGYIQNFAEGNLFAPLDDVIEADLKDAFIPGVKESYAADGKTYGMPLELNISYVFYNKEIFKRYNLEVPQTFEELKNVVKTLADNGVIPATVGNKDGWPGSLWFMYLTDRIGGPTILNEVIDGKVSFNDPAIVQAAAEVQNLVDMNAFEKGSSGLSNDDAKEYFVSERAAMFLTATWELPNYTMSPGVSQEFKDKIGYFKFPLYHGGKGTSIDSYVGGPGVGLFVAENSKVKEQAKAFAAFLVKEWGEKAVAEAGVIPATKVDTEGIDLPPMYVKILDDLNKASNVTTYFDTQATATVSELHRNLITALFDKQVTPEEFAKQTASAIAKEAK